MCNITKTVHLLLARSAEIEARTRNTLTSLHYATKKNRTEPAQLLLVRGSKIEARDNNNQTPLNLALGNTGNTKAIIPLLMEGALNNSLV